MRRPPGPVAIALLRNGEPKPRLRRVAPNAAKLADESVETTDSKLVQYVAVNLKLQPPNRAIRVHPCPFPQLQKEVLAALLNFQRLVVQATADIRALADGVARELALDRVGVDR